MEKDAFPSDQYAIQSQIDLHGHDPKEALIEISPRHGEKVLRHDDIIDAIHDHGDELALIVDTLATIIPQFADSFCCDTDAFC